MTDPDSAFSAGGRLDRQHLRGAVVLALAVAALLVVVPGGVAAQEEPGDPVNVYGEAEDELGSVAPPGTTIYAIVDGVIEDSITVGENGQFGGPEPFAGHLAVNTGAGEELVFAIDGLDGATAFETVDLNSTDELVEVDLTFPIASFTDINVAGGDNTTATDTTGDGLLNDVDGDGEFDIFDVQLLFDNLDNPVVQENALAFNFAGTDEGNVSIADVQGLFVALD